MTTYQPGQRWISEAEPHLGLGLILEADNRQVRVAFLAADEDRTYATANAPLSRATFRVGETLSTHEEQPFEVTRIEEMDGLLLYHGTAKPADDDYEGSTLECLETRLSPHLLLNQPLDRLLTQQIERQQAFELRYHTLKHHARLQQDPLRGLSGARAALLGHQLYIANSVSQRQSPRVLLADEVGLGKTIEASLILHHQLLNNRAERALIVVPDALISQWVLELMRRFNLTPSILDYERCSQTYTTLDEETDEVIELDENPFLTEQLVICSLDFLTEHAQYAQQALDAEWDLLIVDEAHHLGYEPNNISPEYALIERFAQQTPSVLLLTATPEQLGVTSHFARLRLLDPDRFNDLDAFIAQENQYEAAASAVNHLLSNEPLSQETYQYIQTLASDAPSLDALNQAENTRTSLVDTLIDRHGTSRVLFRNTRSHVKGFPKRTLLASAHDSEDEKQDALIAWLKSHKQKVLIIGHSKEQALALEQRLQQKEGILSAAFHEDLSLLARDRAAAWFADPMGARVLVCSEIGSEGRNFQFAQHLVLLDLPDNPALLEQRIGRLDRIGQGDEIFIHAYYQNHSAEAALFRWYNEGLNLFAAPCAAATAVKAEFESRLNDVITRHAQSLNQPLDEATQQALDALIADTQTHLAALNAQLEQGRDRLLELSSYRKQDADALIKQLTQQQQTDALEHYLECVADTFGIDIETHTEQSLILKPNSHYRGGFNDIGSDGITVTSQRDMAVSNDDIKFLSWEHPIILDAFDQMLSSSLGNATIGTLADSPFPAGTLLLEALFVVHNPAPKSLQLGRYLPAQLYRIVVDNQLQYVSPKLPFSDTEHQVSKVDRKAAKAIIQSQKKVLERMCEQAEAIAKKALPSATSNAHKALDETLKPELARLEYLKTINPSVRDDELQQLKQRIQQSEAAIDNTTVRLDAVRAIICV